ncbi:MAG: TIGR04551 family protein [Deltaproteobacteria bacterium]|nr:TIGR04551 family protein [Deltaproteobacteria bacterium]
MMRLVSLSAALALLVAAPRAVVAQGLMPQPNPGAGQAPHKEEKEGPAEAAPEGKDGEPELPPLPPWPGQDSKKLQFFQMQGYFRFRAQLFQNVNLGMHNTGGLTAPFNTPLSEQVGSPVSCEKRITKPVPGGGTRGLESGSCPSNTIAGANIRLRLEPTINVAERVSIHTQIDVFDNLVLGSTPQTAVPAGARRTPDLPLSLFNEGQAAPIAGQNTRTPGILAKRAWAEVVTPVGTIKFGRMPNQWGLGLVHNDGSCWDCNYGDSVDRVVFQTTELAKHTFSMGYDFNSTGPTSLTLASGQSYLGGGQAVDMEQLDDIDQLFWIVGRFDKPEVIKDKVEQGELVLNYGLHLTLRKQDFDYAPGVGLGTSTRDYAAAMIERKGWLLMPDLWFKLLWKKLSIEFEGVLVGGRMANISDQNGEDQLSVLQYGWAFRSQYRLLKDALKIGLEVGMASGGEDEAPNGDIDRRRTFPMVDAGFCGATKGRKCKLSEFRFDYDYHVGWLMFREVLGTVANATYFKPSVQYDLFDSLGGRFDLIYALANRPVAYPGNAINLGLEMDLELYYRNVDEGFFAGIRYGVFFPFGGSGALARPADLYFSQAASAAVAQTLQAYMVVKF